MSPHTTYAALLVGLFSCAPKPPTPVDLSAYAAELKDCPVTKPKASDACGMFTPNGLACVKCPGADGCFERSAVIYCVKGTCLTDPFCARR